MLLVLFTFDYGLPEAAVASHTPLRSAVYASFLIKITPKPNVLTNRYYWHFAQSGLYWDQANKLVSTGGQPQFNSNALKQVKVDTVKLNAEIREIVAREQVLRDEIDKIIAEIEGADA